MATEKHILNKDELSPEDQKKFKDYEARLTKFQEALQKLEEKYMVRAQMSYHMVYADLKIYEKIAKVKDKKESKAQAQINEAIDKTFNQ